MKTELSVVKRHQDKDTADILKTKTDSRIVFLLGLCLTIVIICAYMQVINSDFIGYDDELYVTENKQVQEGFTSESLKWAFTTFHSANWYPLTWLSHMLDCELYGLNPAGHHWTNVEFHLANTLLLFFVLFKMTGEVYRSAFAAALFAVHPLHVESVAWVSERKDLLSTFFGLMMIFAYHRYVKISCLKNYLLVIIFLSLGLMAKPMLVTFPFVLLLLDFWPLKRFQNKKNKNDSLSQPKRTIFDGFKGIMGLILEKIPLFIPVVVLSILTFLAQKSEGAVKALGALSLKTRIANALVSYVSYVSKAIWPTKLAVFYPHPGNTLPVWQILGAALLITIALFLAIRASKNYPYVTVGLLWYLGTLVPVIGLVQVGDQAMADRYTYIPLVGLFIIISWGVSDLFKNWNYREVFLGISSSIILSALIACTFFQVTHWKNSISLFEHAVNVTKKNYDALNSLGKALVDKGNYDEAILQFAKAFKINPQRVDALINLTNVLFLQGKPDEAIHKYKDIIKSNSENADAHYNLAYMLSSQGKFDKAVLHYKETLRIEPKYSKAHYELGNILLNRGKLKESFNHFIEAIKIKPNYAQAYNKIGLILFRQGKLNKASVFFSKAIQIDPNYSEARKNLKMVVENITLKKS